MAVGIFTVWQVLLYVARDRVVALRISPEPLGDLRA